MSEVFQVRANFITKPFAGDSVFRHVEAPVLVGDFVRLAPFPVKFPRNIEANMKIWTSEHIFK